MHLLHHVIGNAEIEVVHKRQVARVSIAVPGGVDLRPLAVELNATPYMAVARGALALDTHTIEKQRESAVVALARALAANEHARFAIEL